MAGCDRFDLTTSRLQDAKNFSKSPVRFPGLWPYWRLSVGRPDLKRGTDLAANDVRPPHKRMNCSGEGGAVGPKGCYKERVASTETRPVFKGRPTRGARSFATLWRFSYGRG